MSYGTCSKTESVCFRAANPIINPYGTENWIGISESFSGRPPPGNGGLVWDTYCARKWGLHLDHEGFPQVMGGYKRCNKPKPAVQVASICQATGVLQFDVPGYRPACASSITTSRWDRIVMVLTTRALPLSSQLGWRHSPSSTTTYLIEDEGSRRLG